MTKFICQRKLFLATPFVIMFELYMVAANTTLYGIENENITLNCLFSKHLLWSWNGNIVYTQSGGVKKSFVNSFGISNKSDLVVYNFSNKYVGNYKCKGTDGNEINEIDFNLILFDNSSKPNLYVPGRQDGTFQENDIVNLKCNITQRFAHDTIMLSLFIDEQLLSRSFPAVEHRYLINHTFEHAIVRCSLAVRKRTISTTEQNIFMNWKPKVRLQIKPGDNVPVGSLATFECTVSSNPVVNKSELCDASGFCFNHTEHMYTNRSFIFQRRITHQNQSGEYTCMAENTIGRGNATVILTIRDKQVTLVHLPIKIVLALLTFSLITVFMVYIAEKAGIRMRIRRWFRR